MVGTDSIKYNTQHGSNIIYESPMLSVEYVEKGSFSIGKRYNYCYCTKDVCESEWYKTCIAPCQVRDVFIRIIDKILEIKE